MNSAGAKRGRAGRAVVVAFAGVAIAGQLALLGAAGWAAANPRTVSDHWTVARYTPSATVTDLADRAGMSERGRFVFYASRPAVLDDARFDEVCTTEEPGIGVLGCYTHADSRIFLFSITTAELEGLQVVVAAHEMLHAAWDRLSAAEQEALAGPLEAAFRDLGPDHELVERIALYEEVDPTSRIPELYAILGSEVDDLPDVLERHYAGWFSDRAAVTSLYTAATTVFRDVDARLTALEDEIVALGATIDGDRTAYTAASDQLALDIDDFNARADLEGGFPNLAAFEEERAAIVARQEELEQTRQALNALIDSYNALLVELEEVNTQAIALNRAINVDLEPLAPETTD